MHKLLVLISPAATLAVQRVMRPSPSVIIVALSVLAFTGSAKIIVVNTTDNVSPGPGETNLIMAINLLEDGDSIHFNIPGPGPFYLVTPPLVPDNGYPPITNHNVTIDGYTQPGSSPNSNTILSSNNANLQIVLDSRDGGARVEDIPGLSTTEATTLLIEGATNVTISGLCFLGPGFGSETPDDPNRYAISFALAADSGHVHGCWFGLDLDRTTVYPFRDAVTGFQAGSGGPYINGTVTGVEKNAANALAARAQFNIIMGEFIPINLEGANARISGNFFNVFPDGLTDYNLNGQPPFIEAFLEIGGLVNNLVLGTDGDGVNDAEERNIFGGVSVAADNRILEFYGSPRTNLVIAGNYFGVGVDGVTRFTNSMKFVNNFNTTTTVRVGSDFDGVSDDLEANVISMNYPFDTLFPTPSFMTPQPFADSGAGARVSLRGNVLIGNDTPPFSFANRLITFTNYSAPYMWTTNAIIPALSPTSTQARLRGFCALAKAPYTNVIIDVYLADEEGWTNGQLFQLLDLSYTNSMGLTQYFGFAQGRTYLGSFTDNGPQDLDPVAGQFSFDISSLNIPISALVTVSANYLADPPGTHNGRTHTSDFAMPITLLPAPRINLTKVDENVMISWPTNSGLLSIQSATMLAPANWMNLEPPPSVNLVGTNYEASLPLSSNQLFFRLAR